MSTSEIEEVRTAFEAVAKERWNSVAPQDREAFFVPAYAQFLAMIWARDNADIAQEAAE